jgi:hypothetical protein
MKEVIFMAKIGGGGEQGEWKGDLDDLRNNLRVEFGMRSRVVGMEAIVTDPMRDDRIREWGILKEWDRE